MTALYREACAHPVLWGVYLVWAITAGMNASMGHTIGGGGLGGLALGAVFVAIAFLGAYAADAQQTQRGVVRALMWVMVACQLTIGQLAGWQTLGLTLDRGSERLQAEAARRGVDKDALGAKRAELKQLGIVRAVEAIAADEKLECARRGKGYPTGEGPECTRLRTELANAKRARKLEEEVAAIAQRLEASGGVGNGNAGTAVPETLASAVSSFVAGRPVTVTHEQVLFALHVFLVGVLEFVGILGKWLFGGASDSPAGSRPAAQVVRGDVSDRPVRGAGDGPFGGAGDTPSASRPPAQFSRPGAQAHLFDPRMLPPAWLMRDPQIAAANDAPDVNPQGGSAVNVINVGAGASPPALVPPRIAARRRT